MKMGEAKEEDEEEENNRGSAWYRKVGRRRRGRIKKGIWEKRIRIRVRVFQFFKKPTIASRAGEIEGR